VVEPKYFHTFLGSQVLANDQQRGKTQTPRLKITKSFPNPKEQLSEDSAVLQKTIRVIV
jgi:hypothetical protein